MKFHYFLLIVFCSAINLFATHNRAGEILYKRVAPYTTTVNNVSVPVYNYSITLIMYTDDGPNVADRCADTLYFGDGSHASVNRMNGLTCSISCNASIPCGEIVSSDPNYRVKKNVFSIIHTYTASGTYIVSMTDRNRNSGIVNIPNSINQAFYVAAYIVINSSTGNNSSPEPTNPPLGQAGTYLCYYHNPTAIDADGDSISYESIIPFGQNSAPIVGYSFPATGTNGYFFIHPYTGQIQWCSPQNIGEYTIAMKIYEWRKNTNGVYQMIGFIVRDMQVIVKAVVVGMNESEISTKGFNSYPNPFDKKLSIEMNQESIKAVKLFDLTGRLILEDTYNTNKILFDTESLPKGVYILEINANGQVFYKKVAKN